MKFPRIASSEITPQPSYLRRREFLQAGSLSLLGISLSQFLMSLRVGRIQGKGLI